MIIRLDIISDLYKIIKDEGILNSTLERITKPYNLNTLSMIFLTCPHATLNQVTLRGL